jgi:hypothetical protein
MLCIMKPLALKAFAAASAAFAAYYLYFLCSVFYELYGPSTGMPRSGTYLVWALQGAACIFAPIAVLAAAGLWFSRRYRPGGVFQWVGRASGWVLLLCVAVNLIIFFPVPGCITTRLHLAAARAFRSAFWKGLYVLLAFDLPPRAEGETPC